MSRNNTIFLQKHQVASFTDLENKSPDQIKELEFGGKVVLSERILSSVTGFFKIPFPLIFKLSCNDNDIFCGVSSFEGETGKVYLPKWMTERLTVPVGHEVKLYVVSQEIPPGSAILLQPMTSDFLDVLHPKAVLETGLQSFTCITDGDAFPIHFNGRVFNMRVTETRPSRTILLTDCDLTVEFMPPADHFQSRDSAGEQVFGVRLDGKPLTEQQMKESPKKIKKRGSPDYDLKRGSIHFKRPKEDKTSVASFDERKRASYAHHDQEEKKREEELTERFRGIKETRMQRMTEELDKNIREGQERITEANEATQTRGRRNQVVFDRERIITRSRARLLASLAVNQDHSEEHNTFLDTDPTLAALPQDVWRQATSETSEADDDPETNMNLQPPTDDANKENMYLE